MQKDPKKRPTCTTLLGHKYFAKRSKDSMVTDLLERIDTVGDGDMENVPRLPGTGPAYVSHDGAETLRAGAAGIARGGGEEEMGTTKIRSRPERKVEEEEEGRCRRQARSM